MVRLDPTDPAYAAMTHEEFLTFRLSVLSAAFDRKAARVLSEKFGLTLAERRVLGAIVYYRSMRFSDLVKCLTIDGGQISRAAAALVKRGLAKRIPDKVDGRSAAFVPTARGRALDARIISGGRNNQRAILSQLTADEREAIYSGIGKLMSWLESGAPPPRTLWEQGPEDK